MRSSFSRAGLVAADTLRMARVRHWIKNLLVFAPLLFSLRLTDPASFLRVLVVFAAFCLGASGLYIVNDIVDREKDRHHPRKRLRPIAAGRVPVPLAATAGIAVVAVALAVAGSVGTAPMYTLASYVALVLAYSFTLKRFVVLDVMCIAFGFLLRVIAGGVAIDVAISRWLLLTTFFLSLFLGFCKRRREFLLEGHEDHRAVLDRYSEQLLDGFILVTVSLTIITYSLYVIDPHTVDHLGTDAMILTVPLAVFGLLRYLYLVYREDGGGDPVAAITRDRPIIVTIILWTILVVVALYWIGAEVLV